MNEMVRIAADRPARVGSFTAREFLAMYEAGAFEDMRVELVAGEIERMAPAYGGHGERQFKVGKLLDRVYNGRYVITVDTMVGIDDSEVRAGDTLVVAPNFDRDGVLEPRDIHLVVEIADTTLSRDMGSKRNAYAGAGIAHYWVVDGKRRVVHIFGEPIDGDYASIGTVKFGDPIAVPGSDETITLD